MIAQFRAADYGLTRCSIGSVVPSLSALANTTKVYGSSGDHHMVIDVWRLGFDGELNRAATVSARHAAPSMSRQKFLATFDMSAGSKSRSPEFPCVSGDWYTFEFVASLQEFGMITFRQDQALPALGKISRLLDDF